MHGKGGDYQGQRLSNNHLHYKHPMAEEESDEDDDEYGEEEESESEYDSEEDSDDH